MSRMVSSPRHLTRPSGVAPVHEQLARNIGHERVGGGRLRGEELLGRRGREISETAQAAPHCWHRPVPCLALRTAAALLRPLRHTWPLALASGRGAQNSRERGAMLTFDFLCVSEYSVRGPRGSGVRGWDAGWHHVGLGGAMRDLTPYARCHYHAPGHTMGACQAYYGGKGILWQYLINKYIVFTYHILVSSLLHAPRARAHTRPPRTRPPRTRPPRTRPVHARACRTRCAHCAARHDGV